MGIRSRCVTLLIDGPEDADPWGREALLFGRRPKIGRLTSGGYSVAFGRSPSAWATCGQTWPSRARG